MLIKCPECQRDVSDTAPSCPGCGYVLKQTPAAPQAPSRFSHLPSYHNPSPSASRRSTGLRGLPLIVVCIAGGLLLVGIVVGVAGGSADTSSNPAASAAAQSPPSDAVAAASSAPAIDLSDARALDDKYENIATASCDTYSDDYVKGVARYDFKWSDAGFMSTKFDHFRGLVVQPGVLTLTSDKLMLQNGFGAYVRTHIDCRYDTQHDKVLGFDILGAEP